ncbi:hypothetical protein SprV_0301379300 [Sparganum proliferum]
MRQARDRQRKSPAPSDSNPGKSVANIFRHRSSSKRGHELPPLLNDNKVFLIDDTDKAELFSAFFAKHLATESDPTKKLRRQLGDPSTSSLSVHLRITEIFEMASRMRQARDRQRKSPAPSDSNPGKSVANIFRHRSSSKRGHELPPLLNDNKVFLIDDTDKAELFSAFFAKHLATESDPVPFVRSLSDRTLSTIDVSSDLIKKHISRLKNSH